MPTIYILGDSTVEDNKPPFRGWGWALPEYLAVGVKVENHAMSGRSTRSFLDEGRFDPVKQGMQQGDVLMIQFGHNDEKEDPTLHTDPHSSYQDMLRMYCRTAMEKGALPVLLSPVSRRIYVGGGSLLYTHGEYPAAVKKVAQELNVPFLDLKMASRELYLSGTEEDTAKLFVRLAPGEHPDFPDGHDDKTHFNAEGAKKIAGLVADMMAREPRLQRYMKHPKGENPMDYKAIADKVLSMLQHADGNDPSNGHLTMNNWEWPTGVALYGIYKTYQQSGDKAILDYLTGWYDDMLSRDWKPHRNVNTVAPALTLTCLYDETRNPLYLEHIESWLKWVLEEMPRTEFGGLQHCTVFNKHYQQLWCDTLFMVCLFLAKAGVVLGRPELIDEAEYQFLLHVRYLQDKITGLFYHGWTFDRRHNYANAKWARGNAWFTASAIELADITGRQNAAMRMILSAWKDQVNTLWKYQWESGLFATLLDREDSYRETSATAAIAYGIMKAVRMGIISDEKYIAMAKLSAQAVLDQIDETGAVQGVSGGTGMGYDLQHYKDIIVTPTAYGQGLTFLMITELMQGEVKLDG